MLSEKKEKRPSEDYTPEAKKQRKRTLICKNENMFLVKTIPSKVLQHTGLCTAQNRTFKPPC